MSRIGNNPITIPDGVNVEFDEENRRVSVKGPKGTLHQPLNRAVEMDIEDNTLSFKRTTNQKNHRALHGLYRSLLANMLEGVTQGYTQTLELVGVGYRAEVKSANVLELNLGYSHNIYFKLPEEIKVSAETVKGKSPIITLQGIDKQLVGQISAKLRTLRKIEPYKGKGVKIKGQEIRRKAGKTTTK